MTDRRISMGNYIDVDAVIPPWTSYCLITIKRFRNTFVVVVLWIPDRLICYLPRQNLNYYVIDIPFFVQQRVNIVSIRRDKTWANFMAMRALIPLHKILCHKSNCKGTDRPKLFRKFANMTAVENLQIPFVSIKCAMYESALTFGVLR